MDKKILVTGGAGYIGSFMVRHLKKSGFDPVIVDNLSQGHSESVTGYRLEVIDLVTEKNKLNELFGKEKFSGVVHMASFIQMGESFVNPSKYYRNNVIGFLNLLDSMTENKVDKIILSSTAGVYGNPEKLPVSEDDIKNPLNPYGETKYIMERMLEDYDSAYGLKFISIRYFNAAGAALDGSIGEDHPNESHLIPLAIKATMEGKEFTVFGNDYDTKDGTCIRDYIHVLDLVETHTLALNALFAGAESNYYNAGVGKGYSNKEVLKMIAETTKIKLEIAYGERRRGDADALFCSNRKIKEELGWSPKLGLKEIVESAYLWHKNHPQGYI